MGVLFNKDVNAYCFRNDIVHFFIHHTVAVVLLFESIHHACSDFS